MINKLISRSVPYIAAAVLALTGMQAYAVTATINPSQDNTLAEELPDNSSGTCDWVFSRTTDNGDKRRALLQFDIESAIPPGSTINNVTLSMTVSRGGDHENATMTLHRVTTAWGEGSNGCGPKGGGQGEAAANGSATWLSAKHNANPPWGTPGGDYSGTASGTAVSVKGAKSGEVVVWDSTVQGNDSMSNDVSDWYTNPTTNYGWILIGDEASPTTARRFDSRENGAAPPVLVVDFTPSGDVEACCTAEGDCSVTLVGSNDCQGTTLPGVDTCEPNQCPQPTGACCNLDESCSDNVGRQFCEDNGGIFQGSSSACSQGSVDCGLTPFVEALPIPPVLEPTGTRADGVLQYTVSVEEATQSVHPELPDTTLWTYNGAWPSSTFVVNQGTPIEVTYVNNLPVGSGSSLLETDTCAHGPDAYGDSKRIVTHLHGGHVPARVDGQPEYHILPGETDVYEYPNNQEAATVWYHDHALGITRLNVYSGMAGFYLIADDEDTLGPDNIFGFPSGQYEIGLAIQDRQFNPDGSLFYNARLEDAFTGDKLLVNGKVWPYLMVDRGMYRFRILNGSQSREYDLRMECTNCTQGEPDPSFILVGTDLGLISAPIDLGNDIGTQGPAERMDVVIDFAGYPAGTEIILRNDDPTLPLLPNVMKFIVTDQPGHPGPISSTLREVPDMPESSTPIIRYFRLAKESVSCTNDPGRTVNEWFIESLDGPDGNVTGKHWDDVTEFPILGTREVWEFENPTSSYHPMHVHLVRFQIVSKTDMNTGLPIPLQPWEENTWKDIVHIPANSTARIIMDFENYAGRFPNHCHLLDHEDHEMMRQFQASYDPAICDNNGTCDPGEDCQSCPNDCTQVSGASCGNGLCEAGDGENCLTCAADCAGKQTGSQSKQFCCGAPGGNQNIGCGVDVNDDRCIDSSANLFCRNTTRVSACCGDALCEGAETISSCANDCDPNACTPTEPGTEVTCDDGDDNDCDGLTDAADPDCAVDSDADGIEDNLDNCINAPNGPLIPDAGGNSQLDGDSDGYGNICDADLNQDGITNGLDTGPFRAALGTNDPVADMNGDGVVNGLDTGPFRAELGTPPGPSCCGIPLP
jgi:spore coat protein A